MQPVPRADTMAQKLLLTILTPERAVLSDKEVDFVAIPAYDGEMGILPGHASYVAQLKEGPLNYRDGAKKEVFAVLNGFAEIHKDKVLVLAEGAELAREISEESARQEYQRARAALAMRGKDMDLDSAQASLRRAIVLMKIAGIKKRPK